MFIFERPEPMAPVSLWRAKEDVEDVHWGANLALEHVHSSKHLEGALWYERQNINMKI